MDSTHADGGARAPRAASGLSYRHPTSGEWAHDVRDPWAEARRVFVAPAWEARAPEAGECLRLLEVGFGRGLNTAAALSHLAGAGHAGPVEALGFEPHPEWLQPWPACPPECRPWAPWWGRMRRSWQVAGRPWKGQIPAQKAAVGLLERGAGPPGFRWIFLDLFSPGRHPADWEPELFPRLARAAAPGAVLTSYCCARSLREGLERSGWQVERLRIRGSKDSLRAVQPL